MKQMITVIIPIFNGEKYIQRCYSAMAAQTYKNIKLIFVNDGSTDNSLKILDSIKDNNQNIFVINQENKGVSAARNVALKMFMKDMESDYVSFVDIDDVIEEDYFEKMLSEFAKNDFDIVGCQYKVRLYNSGDCQNSDFAFELYNFQDYIKQYYQLEDNLILRTVWGKIYKKDIIKECCFDEKLKYGEDNFFNFCLFSKDIKASFIDYVGYHYIQHMHSAVGSSKLDIKKEQQRLFSDLYVENSIYNRIDITSKIVDDRFYDKIYVILCMLVSKCSLKEFVKGTESISITSKHLKGGQRSRKTNFFMGVYFKNRVLFYALKKLLKKN